MVVGGRLQLVLNHIHLPILLVVVDCEGAVDGDLFVVGTQSVLLCVLVEEQPSLQQSVIGGLYAWH